MTADNAAKANGRETGASSQKSRTTRTIKAKATEAVTTNEALAVADTSKTEGRETASTDNVVQIAARPVQTEEKQSAVQLQKPSLTIWNRPVMPSEIEVAETMSVAGIRPVAVSHLELAGSFMNGRPIAASHLKVHEMLPGGRPIFDSEIKMVEGALLPGSRPIMASNPQLLESSGLPGNRPIASNDVDDSESLMGFLD